MNLEKIAQELVDKIDDVTDDWRANPEGEFAECMKPKIQAALEKVAEEATKFGYRKGWKDGNPEEDTLLHTIEQRAERIKNLEEDAADFVEKIRELEDWIIEYGVRMLVIKFPAIIENMEYRCSECRSKKHKSDCMRGQIQKARAADEHNGI